MRLRFVSGFGPAFAITVALSLTATTAHAGPLLDADLSLDGTLVAQVVIPPPPPAPTPPPPAYPGGYQPMPPPVQPYYQPPVYAQAQPRQMITEYQPRWGLIIAGLTVFAVAYVSDIAFTYGFNHQPAWESLIPVAGPLIQTSDSFPSLDGAEGVARFFLIWDFIGQATGATLALLGAVLQKKVNVYTQAGPNRVAWYPTPRGVAIRF
jgi:hypothetical protein